MLGEQTAKLTGTQGSFEMEERQKATTVLSGTADLRNNCGALVSGAGKGISRSVKQKSDISETAFSTISLNPIVVLDGYSGAQESADHRRLS